MPRPSTLLSTAVCMLAALLPASATAREDAPKLPRVRTLETDAYPTLDARLPEAPNRPVRFRRDRRAGWVVRMAHPRAPAPEDAEKRLATVPSPAVHDGRVFASVGFDGWALHAFEAEKGKHVWTTKLEDNGPTAPTVTPRKLVCNSESCTTYVITPRDGKIAWKRWIGPTVMGAAAVHAGIVYTAHRTKQNEYRLTAMRLESGDELWTRSLTRDIYGKPIVRGGRIYVGCRDGVVCCFELNGRPVWFSRPDTACAPWVTDKGVYISEGSPYRKGPPAVRCLDPDTGITLWRTDTELANADEQGHIRRVQRPNRIVRLMSRYGADGPRPVVVGSRCILAGGRDLIGLDAKTGDVRWMRRLPEERRFHAPPAVLGGRLLYVTLRGLLVEVDAASGRPRKGLDLQQLVTSQPVVADGRVHVTAGALLYGIPWGAESGPSWPQWGGDGASDADGRVTTPR